MKRLWKNQVLALLMVLPSFTGCASIVGKSAPQIVTINSSPTDADLRIENIRDGSTIYIGKTPYSATLNRSYGYFKKAYYKVIIEKDGYEKKQLTIYGSPNGWYLGGNFIFGGLIGYLVVDPLTGAMWTLTPEKINAELAQKTTLAKTGDGLVIMTKEDVPMELRGQMQPVPVSAETKKEQ